MRLKIGIVIGEFHKKMSKEMLDAAESEITGSGNDVGEVIWVPGAYEIPLAMKHILKQSDVDAAVMLGYIEKGETLHGEVMGHVTHHAVTDLSLEYEKPVGVGVIGPGATREQAEKRAVKYAEAAVKAAITLAKRLKK